MSAESPLPPELWDKTPPDVREAIRTLVLIFEGRIAALEARLGQDSSNSSRPPSSDGPRVKRGVPRVPSGRRRGGQQGHPKHGRVILPPDEVHDHKPSRCGRCDSPLAGDDPDPVIDQVIELPVVMRHVIHHRRHTLTCAGCRALTTAEAVPEAATGFGPRLQAAVAYFSGVGRLGKRAIALLFADLCAIPMALGSVSNLEARTGAGLESIHDQALGHARGLDANVDETGWKQGARKAWVWVAVTKSVTVFLIRKHRDRAAFDDLVGPTPGVLTTDRYPVYAHLPSARRQVCWAHLRRDFQAMIDRRDRGSPIGEDLLMYADILAEHWLTVREGTATRPWFGREVLPWLRDEVRQLLEAGSGCGPIKTAGVCRDLLAIEASLWTFASRPGVEPTNNAAERAVRHAVCWRKTSYGTDGERGRGFVERMLTVVASCRSQGRSVMEFVTQAILAHQGRAAKPSILPDRA
jgi:transposase